MKACRGGHEAARWMDEACLCGSPGWHEAGPGLARSNTPQSPLTATASPFMPALHAHTHMPTHRYLHGNGDLMKRGEFEAKKAALAEYRRGLADRRPRPLLGASKALAGRPLLQVGRVGLLWSGLSCVRVRCVCAQGMQHCTALRKLEPPAARSHPQQASAMTPASSGARSSGWRC